MRGESQESPDQKQILNIVKSQRQNNNNGNNDQIVEKFVETAESRLEENKRYKLHQSQSDKDLVNYDTSK